MLLLFSGCETTHFYSQAAKGQLQLLSNRKSVKKLIQSEETDPKLKDRLALTQRILKFAESELGLDHHGNYQKFTQLDRPHVVWNVYAAPEFSMVDKEWWYPFVGSLSYRGYFKEKYAREYAEKLSDEGLDTFVGGVAAYSTLGYFNDPLLSTFIFDNEPELAELIFHELAHTKKFHRGDTDFNEAFATAIAQEGTRLWLIKEGKTDWLKRYDAGQARHKQFVDLVISTKEELDSLYEIAPEEPSTALTADLRIKKQQIFDRMRSRYDELKVQWNGYRGFDRWMDMPINNAQINTVTTYYELEPVFTQLIRESATFEEFYEKAELMAEERKNTE